MLQERSGDVFLHYSLGMEYASGGNYGEAVGQFKRCIELDGEYLAAYVEAGKSLRLAGRLNEARAVFAEALGLADKQNQTHTRDYVQQQLDVLGK